MNGRSNVVQYLFAYQRWVVHAFFWVFVLVMYVIFFGRQNSNYLQTFFFVGLLMPVTIGTTYFFNYWLVPKYFMQARYGLFLLYFSYTVLGSVFLEMVVAMFTYVVIAELKLRDMSPASVDIFFLLTSLLMVAFFGAAIKLLLQWRRSNEDYQQLMREKLEAELKFLKNQLNPHFLFNTLNNLYYLAIEKSDKTPQAILALSEMLDYVLHESKSVFVPLARELQQVDNYIALELLRYGDRVRVVVQLNGQPEGYTIGPMLLITLLENSFKHGAMHVAGKSWIHMRVTCTDAAIIISVCNSRKNTSSGKGIGLENLRRQLAYLYDSKHSLVIEANKPDEFSVNLTIPGKHEIQIPHY